MWCAGCSWQRRCVGGCVDGASTVASAVASAAAAVVAATAGGGRGGEMGIFLSLFANAVAEVTRAPTARGAGARKPTITRFALLLDFLECVYELFVLLCWSGVRGCGGLLPSCFQVAFYNTGPGAGREHMNDPPQRKLLYAGCHISAQASSIVQAWSKNHNALVHCSWRTS